MIFVTVGTHEQSFDRLIKYIDELKSLGEIDEEIIIQTGFSTYNPKYCKWSNLLSYNDMVENIRNARIVITHGGPSSFIMPLQEGKVPIVVPRQKKYNEHINNHQLEFANEVANRQGNIIVIEDIEELNKTIKNYDIITKSMNKELKSNNQEFNDKLKKVVLEILK